MNHVQPWQWTTLLLLGAWHGVNPGMGWLLAAAKGIQQQSDRAVWLALLPIAAGHLISIGSVALLGTIAGAVLPLGLTRIAVVALLLGFGVYRLISRDHPALNERHAGFRQLTLWSFLMASAHGAGIMLLPLLLGIQVPDAGKGHHHHPMAGSSLETALAVVTIHTMAYLLTTGTVAWVVYKQISMAFLRRASLSLDRVWAFALIATAGAILFAPMQ